MNYDHDGRLRPGYYGADGQWIDVLPIDSDHIARQWAETNYRTLFGIAFTTDDPPSPDLVP